MREKTPNRSGFLLGPVKLADMARADMYLNYLAQIKKGDRLLFTFPNLPMTLNEKPTKKHY